MPKSNDTACKILKERFGKDSLLGLATVSEGKPYVRTVDAYYEDGAFYVVTHALSGKMRQIDQNPAVALCGDWFTAHGTGRSLGSFAKAENASIAQTLRSVFQWLDNGHTDPADETTVILQIRLTDGVLWADGQRFDLDFSD